MKSPSDTTPTDEQRRAAETRGCSVVLSSGAGCGKTRVLTDRYLSHLVEDRARVGELLAITFTDKAAKEMRKRIRSAVERRAKTMSGDDRDRWHDELRSLETAAISTIHAFCASLLRNYSLVAGLDPRFQILEEVVAPNLREDAINEALLELIGARSAAGAALDNLVQLYGWCAVQDTVISLVAVPDRSGWQSWLTRPPAEIGQQWRNFVLQSAFPALIDAGGEEGQLFDSTIALLTSMQPPGAKMAGRFSDVVTAIEKLKSTSNIVGVLKSIRDAAKVQGGEPKSAWRSESDYDRVRDRFKKIRELIDKQLLPMFDGLDELESAAKVGQDFLIVASECGQKYSAAKSARGYLDFQDLLVQARDLLRDCEEVRRACQRRFRYIVVDELQDTDPVQMQFIELLCGGDLAKGKLFAVGDSKQSIYRFRGADVSLFEELKGKVPERGRQTLSVNFRSQPGIIDFTNALFRTHMLNYEPLVPSIAACHDDPVVEFLWGESTGSGVDHDRAVEARRIASRIAEMVADKRLLASQRSPGRLPQARPVQLGDVVLLFRAMTNVSIYENALREAGIDYYLVGGRAFYAQQEIYDWLNLLCVLENPHDALALAGVMRSPFGCISDEGLYLLARHDKGLWSGLRRGDTVKQLSESDRVAAKRLAGWLANWRAAKDRLPIATLMNRILADSAYDAAMMYEHLGDRKLANLWKLVDQARTFDALGGYTLDDFVRRLTKLVSEPPREEQAATQPEEADVVRIMSIHQAKGLEFPVVFVPDIAAKPGGQRTHAALWDAELGCLPRPPAEDDPPLFPNPQKFWRISEEVADRAEDYRNFYVACTRAMDYLILSATWPKMYKPTNTATRLLTDRFDLATGKCLDPKIPWATTPRITVQRLEIDGVQATLPIRQGPARPLTAADAKAAAPLGKLPANSDNR